MLHGVDQPEGADPGLLDVHIRVEEPRVGHEERRQGEGHLGRIEPLLRCAILRFIRRLADADEWDSQAVLVEVPVQAADLEIRGQEDLVDVGARSRGNPGGRTAASPRGRGT